MVTLTSVNDASASTSVVCTGLFLQKRLQDQSLKKTNLLRIQKAVT